MLLIILRVEVSATALCSVAVEKANVADSCFVQFAAFGELLTLQMGTNPKLNQFSSLDSFEASLLYSLRFSFDNLFLGYNFSNCDLNLCFSYNIEPGWFTLDRERLINSTEHKANISSSNNF